MLRPLQITGLAFAAKGLVVHFCETDFGKGGGMFGGGGGGNEECHVVTIDPASGKQLRDLKLDGKKNVFAGMMSASAMSPDGRVLVALVMSGFSGTGGKFGLSLPGMGRGGGSPARPSYTVTATDLETGKRMWETKTESENQLRPPSAGIQPERRAARAGHAGEGPDRDQGARHRDPPGTVVVRRRIIEHPRHGVQPRRPAPRADLRIRRGLLRRRQQPDDAARGQGRAGGHHPRSRDRAAGPDDHRRRADRRRGVRRDGTARGHARRRREPGPLGRPDRRACGDAGESGRARIAGRHRVARRHPGGPVRRLARRVAADHVAVLREHLRRRAGRDLLQRALLPEPAERHRRRQAPQGATQPAADRSPPAGSPRDAGVAAGGRCRRAYRRRLDRRRRVAGRRAAPAGQRRAGTSDCSATARSSRSGAATC